MKTAHCPSCGAPVAFRSASSLYAVCEFCRSTLLRDGEALKNLGRMAELMDDPSRIQLGTEGSFRGTHFAVIGRIQLKYDAGLWNEWHLLFDDGRSGWLSEAGGEYVVSSLVPVDAELPAFDALQPEMPVTIAGRIFFVADLQTARCIAGAGELPFKVESGYDVNAADLRGNDRFVTIDYSETPPLVFVGYPAQFDELGLANLKVDGDASPGSVVKATAFNCPHCAAPLTIHSGAIESIGCVNCGSIIGVENDKVRLLAQAAQQMKVVPWLPLGSKGTLNGVAWEAIGFLRRSTRSEGVEYAWSEYLLFNAEAGFAWLTEYQGHWNFARTLPKPPTVARGQMSFSYQRKLFKRFSAGMAEVTYVEGEFYWRVSIGESCLVEDFICPPRMLSRELTDKEVTWSAGEYLEPEALCAAFGITALPPKRIGVYANQPNPLHERHRKVWQLFWPLALAATCVQLFFVFFVSSQVVLKQPLVLSAANDEALTTREFVLDAPVRSLRVKHRTDVDNNWIGLNTTLVEKNSGEAYQGAQEISYYSGSEGGERWSEGSRDDAISFRNVPAGTYYLNVEYELGGDRNVNPRVVDTIEVIGNPVPWSNYVLVILFLLAFPLFSRWRRNAFEAERWSESDLGGDNDSDDEDE